MPAGIGDAPDPYPALRAHLRAGQHPHTYTVGDQVICEECGEKLNTLEADKIIAANNSLKLASLKAIAAQAEIDAAQARSDLANKKQALADAALAAGVQP